jgi:transcriptional regulator with XRE-family HTH domain
MNKLDKKIGERVKLFRKFHNMTQHDLSLLLEKDQPAISRIENGAQSLALSDAIKLSSHTGFDFDLWYVK